jgi:hypothetical protein
MENYSARLGARSVALLVVEHWPHPTSRTEATTSTDSLSRRQLTWFQFSGKFYEQQSDPTFAANVRSAYDPIDV